MRKIFYILTLLIIFVSCSTAEYRIAGKIEGANDGDSVALGYSIYGDEFTQTDVAIIKNEQFEFNGNVNGCKIYYIVYENDNNEIYAPLFLEEGNINVELSQERYHITGTPTNDLNTSFEETLTQQIKEIYEIQNRLYSDSLMSDSVRSMLSLDGYEKQTNSMAYVRELIRDNITSMFGLYLIVQFYDLFDADELTQLAASIPKENCDRENNCLYDILQEIVSDINDPRNKDDLRYNDEIEKELMKEEE